MKFLNRNSLSFKLFIAILIPILIILTSTYVYLNNTITTMFREFQVAGGQQLSHDVVELLKNYYANQSGWEGVETFIESRSSSIDEEVAGRELILADAMGRVIASSDGKLRGRRMNAPSLEDGIAIELDGRQVGTLMIGPVIDNFSPREALFLQSTDNALLLTGLVGLAIALLIGFILHRQFLAPLHRLTEAVRSIRKGELNQSVQISRRDEIGQLAKAFNEMSRHLKQLEESRNNMISDIAHELRTPITAIQCNLEVIIDGAKEPKVEHLVPLYEQTHLLTRLVEDLQMLSIAETGQLQLRKFYTDFGALLQEILLIFKPQLEERNIQSTLDIASDLPLIQIDPLRMRQVILNLMGNALRYTPNHGALAISVQSYARELIFSLSDTGPGIASYELASIFERFYRVDRSRSRSSGGTGLGLAIAKEIINAHGGEIWAESYLGQGSTFYFRVPIHENSETTPQSPTQQPLSKVES